MQLSVLVLLSLVAIPLPMIMAAPTPPKAIDSIERKAVEARDPNNTGVFVIYRYYTG
jgi:hypothetical protein